MNIVLEYPRWFLLLCILAGAVYASFLYFRNRKLKEVSKNILYALAALRFLLITFLCFLLLSPLIKTVKRTVEKPVIIVAEDNSESVVAGKDSVFYKKKYKEELQQLITQLNEKYEVRIFSFGDQLKAQNSLDEINFKEKKTALSPLFDELNVRFSNRNLGAVIVATDGLYNYGSNPLYASAKLKAPVYTIALGDTAVKKDIILLKTDYNKIVYLGNDFPVEAVVSAKQLKGKTTTLTVSKGNTVLFSKSISFNSEDFIQTIPLYLTAKETGLQHYKVMLSSLPEEITTANNVNDIYIDVLDARQKVVILADAPHPDIAALRSTIEKNQNYEVESYLIADFDKPIQQYDLVILHQLPSLRNPVIKLKSDIEANHKPVWIFTGGNQFIKNDFSVTEAPKANSCEPLLEPDFPLFTLSDELRKGIDDFPIVTSPFMNTSVSLQSNVLLYQKIGVVQTKNPLFYFDVNGENKKAFFVGEGLWRWRLQDYAQHGNHHLTEELISKTVQYLSVKTDKSFFRIKGKKNYPENEPIEMEAEVYNESYELINAPDVSVIITDTANKKYPFVFSKTSNAYRLNAGVFPVGEYAYEAKVKVGQKIYIQKGKFTVSALQIELTNTVADHGLLYTLAKNHGGEMLYPLEMQQLIEKLNNREDVKQVVYSENKLDDLLHQKWIFFLLLGLLAIEWVIRKRNGAY